MTDELTPNMIHEQAREIIKARIAAGQVATETWIIDQLVERFAELRHRGRRAIPHRGEESSRCCA